MPRMAFAEMLAAVCIGRPMRCLEPAPCSSTGVAVAAASASTRENSRSSTGRIFVSTLPLLRGVARSLATVERKYLGRVEQPFRVEHGFDAHLQGQVGLV